MKEDGQTLKKLINFRTPLYNKDFPLILFWSQKSGCTSLVKWFFSQNGLLKKALEYHPWIHKYENNVYKKQLNYKKEIMEQIMTSKKDTFKLVRNPYKRAVSSYLFYSNHLNKGSRYSQIQNEKIMEALFTNNNSNNNISFKQFLHYIQKVGATNVESHFAQQYIDGEEFFINNYIYLENFNKQILEIEEKYGLLKTPLSQITDSHHHYSKRMKHDGNYADMIPDKEFWKKNLPTYDSFYDNETIDLVKEIFKKDFKVYKYNTDFL
ncbi:sulfotransferase family 2 domain-containing protein [Alkalihalobacterium elongatum]|uniref:sulfotransferase family 2 domain-containing protein n=1 Tax=Alkalihalobacterium elongatum TaxID=2675466 RepID=UPI001C1F4C54|nr:sulfotransferase family 2 domain-containing protein [Alkalihalobacterium elongatum]